MHCFGNGLISRDLVGLLCCLSVPAFSVGGKGKGKGETGRLDQKRHISYIRWVVMAKR